MITPGRAVTLALVLAAAFAAAAEPARAVESVGIAPIADDESNASADAVRNAVRAALLRSARELLPEDFVPPEPPASGGEEEMPGPDDWLEERLGEDPFVYASSFRILEDRGRRPAMFSSDPEVEFEYVVVVDVVLDRGSIRERMEALGLLEAERPASLRELSLVLQGLRSYRPVAMVRQTLESDPRVSSVLTARFSEGSVELRVQAETDARRLVSELRSRAPEGLSVVAVEVGEERATLLVDVETPNGAADAASGP